MTEENSKDYGKRPLWQWVFIYVVIGGLVYGVIYYFWLSKRGYSVSPTGSSPTQQSVPYSY